MIRVIGQLGLDGSGWQAGLTRAEVAASRFARGVSNSVGAKLAAAFSVGAVVGLAKKTVEYADTIDETASRIGVGTKALQEWNFAAQQSGASTEKLMTFVERLSAAAADPKNAAAFAAMGISPQGMTPESLFRSVAGWAKGKSVTTVSEGLGGVMDDRAVRPVLNLLTSDLDAAAASANKLGAVMEEGTVKRLAQLNDQLAIVGQVLMTNFAPALIWLGVQMMEITAKLKGGKSIFDSTLKGAVYGGMKNGLRGALDPLGAGESPRDRVNRLIEGISGAITGASGGFKAGSKEAKGGIRAMAELIERMKNFSGGPLPTIDIPAGARDRVTRGSSDRIQSDSLLSVGNFLGSGRDAISNIQRQQLTALNKIEMNTRRKPEESGSLIIP